jgi:hypothetical protein
MSDFAHTFGALIVVVSILSMAEVARKLRKLNYVLALVLAVATFWSGIDLITMGLLILACIGLVVLSVPEGKLQESYN